MTTCFLVGIDGSEGAARAAEFAAQRARAESGKLILAHVVDWSPYELMSPQDLASRSVDSKTESDEARTAMLEPVAAKLGADVNVELVVRHGHPAETMAELATELGATQVFVGRRGRSRLKTMLFGSVSGSLVQACSVPLTVVP